MNKSATPMDWSHQRVLVTGGGGFIGSCLVERLVELGAQTRTLVRYNSGGSWGWLDDSPVRGQVEVSMGDLRDPETLSPAFQGTDVVFHLAALIAIPYSYRAPRSYVHINVEGTLNALQAAVCAGVRLFVHTSTSEVYGTAQYLPIDETHPLQGQSPYAASKIGADKMAEAFHLSYNLPLVTLRPFNTFGPRQSARAVVPTIITQALTQREVRLGSLGPTRDLNFVADTVEGFIRAAQSPDAVGRVINVGSGREIAVGHLARTILELVDRDVPVVTEEQRVRPEHSEVQRLCADYTLARQMLGWQPRYSLEEGLGATIQWMERHLEQYRADAYAL